MFGHDLKNDSRVFVFFFLWGNIQSTEQRFGLFDFKQNLVSQR